MSIFTDNQQPIFQIGIDETARAYMLQTARWTKFLAIAGFVLIGILMLAGALLGYTMSGPGSRFADANPGSSLFSAGVFFIYLIVGALYFYPVFALLKFSSAIKKAILFSDQPALNNAFRYQRNMFRYLGILLIVILLIYGLAIIGIFFFYGMRTA